MSDNQDRDQDPPDARGSGPAPFAWPSSVAAPEPTPTVSPADASWSHPAGTASPAAEPAAEAFADRPEVQVGAAFAGGLFVAMILKRLGR